MPALARRAERGPQGWDGGYRGLVTRCGGGVLELRTPLRLTYVATHFAPFFETIDRLTTVGAEDYIASRLRKVGRSTVSKELSVLRRLRSEERTSELQSRQYL